MEFGSAPSPLVGEGWGEGDGRGIYYRACSIHRPPLPNPLPPGERG